MPIQLQYDTLTTPIGTILLAAKDDLLYALDFSEYEARMKTLLRRYYGDVTLVKADNPYGLTTQINQYFTGNIHALDSIRTANCGTDFQQQVWQALRAIAPATTLSYAALAKQIANPKAVRAVGMANSKNPIAIVVPCHRVITSNGDIAGYAGGIERKEWLLAHEKRMAA